MNLTLETKASQCPPLLFGSASCVDRLNTPLLFETQQLPRGAETNHVKNFELFARRIQIKSLKYIYDNKNVLIMRCPNSNFSL